MAHSLFNWQNGSRTCNAERSTRPEFRCIALRYSFAHLSLLLVQRVPNRRATDFRLLHPGNLLLWCFQNYMSYSCWCFMLDSAMIHIRSAAPGRIFSYSASRQGVHWLWKWWGVLRLSFGGCDFGIAFKFVACIFQCFTFPCKMSAMSPLACWRITALFKPPAGMISTRLPPHPRATCFLFSLS